MTKPDFHADLTSRGLVHQATSDELVPLLRAGSVTAYIGFDPTADSLHVGSLLQVLGLMRLQRAGHHPIAVVGGGTGMIGDPSGKSAERNLLTTELLDANLAGQRKQLERFLDFKGTHAARVVNNLDWLAKLDLISFLRDVGKHFSVNAMVHRDSVQLRLSGRDQGLSFTEFSYALLQAYDYLELYDRYGCKLQMGGSDQWGNITDGCELIRRLRQDSAYGLTMPLITKADGSKFGKTESGTVWLDPQLTSPYAFYQFWLNTSDSDVVRYLKYFTFLDKPRIDALEAVTSEQPDRREAQRVLAQEVTRLVHGDAAVVDAERSAEKLFKGEIDAMSSSELRQVFSSVPSSETEYRAEGWPITEFLSANSVTSSKGEAARLIRGGGISLNGRRVSDEKAQIRPEDAMHGEYFVVRKGKRDNYLVRICRPASP